MLNIKLSSAEPEISFSGNVALWTTSIILSLVSIVFAFVASFYSSKASKNVKTLIKTQWITDQANKIFFTNLKEIDALSSKLISRLRSSLEITYFDYASLSSNCRIHPISHESIILFEDTSFKELSILFRKVKSELDRKFFELVSIDELKQIKNIDQQKIQELIQYHLDSKDQIKKILREYIVISTS